MIFTASYIEPPVNGDAYCDTSDDKRFVSVKSSYLIRFNKNLSTSRVCSGVCKPGYRFDLPDSAEGDELINEFIDGSWSLGAQFPPCKR